MAEDLTTVPDVKLYMGITGGDEDAKLAALINAASRRIERLTGRTFHDATYRERINARGQQRIRLKHWPVIDLVRVSEGRWNALDITHSSGTDIRAMVSVTADSIVLRSTSSTGVVTKNELLFSTSGSTSALKTAIDAVSGWSATVVENVPSVDLNPEGSITATNDTVQVTYPKEVSTRNYTLDFDSGLIGVAAGGAPEHWTVSGQPIPAAPHVGFQSVLVEYVAGYEVIPHDLMQLANEFVKQMYDASQQNSAVQSESLGDYSYTLAGQVDDGELLSKISQWKELR